jgi:transcriptional regulator with XRE-family HTH domain
MHEGEKAFRDLLEIWKDDPEFVAEGIALELSVAVNSALTSMRMTQKQLAEKIHVSSGRISQILKGNLNLTLLSICKVALGVGLKPAVAFEETGSTDARGGRFSELGAWTTAFLQTLSEATGIQASPLCPPRPEPRIETTPRVLPFSVASPAQEGVA